MTAVAIRIYTGIVALICTAALTFALSAQDTSGRWQKQVAYWERMAGRSERHDRLTARQVRRLAVRYNKLVVQTRRSQARLLQALNDAQRQPVSDGTSYTQTTAYSPVTVPAQGSSGSGGGGGGAPVPSPTSSPPPPTTQPS